MANWSFWALYEREGIERSVPDKPGVYKIRATVSFGRAIGSSPIVYIGSADSLKGHLVDRMIHPDRWAREERMLSSYYGYRLEFSYAKASNEQQAKEWEAERLREYFDEHGELPPGNVAHPNLVQWP